MALQRRRNAALPPPKPHVPHPSHLRLYRRPQRPDSANGSGRPFRRRPTAAQKQRIHRLGAAQRRTEPASHAGQRTARQFENYRRSQLLHPSLRQCDPLLPLRRHSRRFHRDRVSIQWTGIHPASRQRQHRLHARNPPAQKTDVRRLPARRIRQQQRHLSEYGKYEPRLPRIQPGCPGSAWSSNPGAPPTG